MIRKLLFFAVVAIFSYNNLQAQLRPIKIVDEKQNNRILLYAVNENDQDLDVALEVTGSGFRQSKGKPRMFRVPAASKVMIKSLIVERGKRPSYKYEVTVNDSLSRRVIRKPFEQIKIDPPKNVLVYLKDGCSQCDTLVRQLDSSYYKYRVMNLEEKPEVKDYLINAFRYTKTPYDSISNPIVSIGGKLYPDIGTFEELLPKLKDMPEEEADKEEEENDNDGKEDEEDDGGN